MDNISFTTVVFFKGNNSTLSFDFPFDYLKKSFVCVDLNGKTLSIDTDYTIVGRTVIFRNAPTSDDYIRIYRKTSSEPIVTWLDESVLKASDMTLQQRQVLHILEEAKEQVDVSISNMLTIAGTVMNSEQLQQIVDQLNAITMNVTEVENSRREAALSAAQASFSVTQVNSLSQSIANNTADLATQIEEAQTAAAEAQNSAQQAADSATAASQIANIGVDATLTVSGAAADSKTVGERLELLDTTIKEDIPLSTNIWNGEYIDRYIFNFGSLSAPVPYNKGLLIGYLPVEEGHTYTVTNGANLVGSLLFFDQNKHGICGINSVGATFGNNSTSWPTIDNLVEVSGVGKSRTFKPLVGSNIKYVCWYITKDISTDYIGEHTDTETLAYLGGIQANESNYPMQYQPVHTELTPFLKELYSNKSFYLYNSKVLCIKKDNLVYMRSHFTEDEDILISCDLKGSQNNTFNFTTYKTIPHEQDYLNTDGSLWKMANDDITPIYFNSSYRAGNHGDDRGYILSFLTPHNFTEVNIGEIWVDYNGNSFIIIQILNTTQILGALLATERKSNASCFLPVLPISPLSRNGVSINFNVATRTQLKPIVNHINISLHVDSKEITDNGVYGGDYVDVVEAYDLLYLPAMITKLINNVGNNNNNSFYDDTITEKYGTVTNVYRFTERGATTLIQSIEWDKTVNFSFAGMVQSISIGDYYCVPGTQLQTLRPFTGVSVEFAKEKWNDINKPPNRYYQFYDAIMSKGICLGYNTEIGTGKDIIRKNNSTAGFLFTSKKLYPKLLTLNADTSSSIYAVSYRVPLNRYDNDIPAIGWYYKGKDIYVLIDVQKTVDKHIKLPDYMVGKNIKVVDSYGEIQIKNEFVTAKGIKVTVVNYGSVVLKLTD